MQTIQVDENKTDRYVDVQLTCRGEREIDRYADRRVKVSEYEAGVRARGVRGTLAFQMARYRSLQKGRDTDKCNIINAEHTHNTSYL